MSERCPTCGAMYALVGRVHLCRPHVTNVETVTNAAPVTNAATNVTPLRVTNKRAVKRITGTIVDGVRIESIGKRKRGRPRSTGPLSPAAERKRRQRERARAKGASNCYT